MKLFNLKKTMLVSAVSLVSVLGLSSAVSAQGQWGNQNKRVVTEKKVVITKLPPQEPHRQQWGNQNNGRYRVYRNGSYYNTDNRGAALLRQAVQNGYQQGLQAGKSDRNSRRGSRWNNNSMYRSGTYGYQSYVDQRQYQYYFQQGFERGYQDGYNSRQQYGSSNNGSFNILGTILNGILNLQQY